jgi:hypothetical protein
MRIVAAFFLVVVGSVWLVAQNQGALPPGSKLFIANMAGGLDGFISPEIRKQKVPLSIVIDEKDADYVLMGASHHAGGQGVEAHVQIVRVKDKTIVWSEVSEDKPSMFRGPAGLRKIAERLVRSMKRDLFSEKSK